MAWKTPWVTSSSFFTSLLYIERQMEIACSFGCSGDDGEGDAVSEEDDLVMHGSSKAGGAFSSRDGW